VLREYRKHYNMERPHRSCNLRPPAARDDATVPVEGPIRRSTRLGGLLNDYRRVPLAA